MSSHHDSHSTEVKEVSFITPLILALVTVLVILLAVSTCDRGHGCETNGKHGHGGHEGAHSEATATEHGAAEHAPATSAHAEEAHH